MQHTVPSHQAPKKKGRGKKIALWVAGAFAVVVVVGALLDDSPTEGETANASPSARASVPPSTTRFVSWIPMPDGQQTEDLLYGLRRIHPALDRARSIDRARNVCRQILDDMPREKVIEGARLRFEGGDVTLTQADAEAIVELIERGGWCR